jgi:replication-associated recombination protein RarA
MPIYKIDQAVRSRCISIDLSMTSQQKIDRMRAIIKTDEFLPAYKMETKKEALKLLEKLKDEARELSLRTLISVTKVAGRGGDWQKRAEYLIMAA